MTVLRYTAIGPCAGRSSADAKSRWKWIRSGCTSDIPERDRLRPIALAHQFRECWNIAVAFNERRPWANALDELFVKAPHLLADGSIVTVDEEGAFSVDRVTGEMDFTDPFSGEVIQPSGWVVAQIVRTDGEIVHVDQQAAAASAREFGEKARLAPAVVAQSEIVGWVLDKDLPPERILDSSDVGGAARKHLIGAWHRQEVGKAATIEPRPGQML